ncbi:helix-hairpin-helix domain-containing protein [Vicingaceae bacterium]|nr:helix-hairpin-helix domain-containing protein [Vicingaceae bacterium]
MRLIKNHIVCFSGELRVILLSLLLIISTTSYSQNKESKKNKIIEKRVEYLIEDAEESGADYTTIFDQLSYYFDHPLNLNRADLDNLEELGLLTSIQINNLLGHIEENGKLMTLEELQTVEGFDDELIRLLLPFVKVSTNVDNAQLSFKELLKNGDNQLFVRYEDVLEEKKGFSSITDSALAASPNSRYLGSEAKLYTRYRYKYGNHLSVGFTAEKDAGEEFFNGAQKKGFDFYSGHFFIKNQGRIKQLGFGDYQAQFGQGLTYWSGAAFGKSADIMLIKRSATGLKPYTSVDESRFLRGGGIALQFDNIEVTAFYSYNKEDANISLADSSTIDGEVLAVTSVQQTGFHRTFNEIEDKDAITQQKLGGHLAYKTRKLNVGLTGIHSQLNSDFTPTLATYSQFRNSDNVQTNVGLDYNWIFKNFNFFGEISNSLDAGTAFVSGALITLDPKLSLAVLYRDYQRNFQPISSAGIGEGSTNENEKGMYMGFIAKPAKKWTLSAYYDQFTFPWLKFGINAPSKGYQYLAQLTYKPSKKMELYIRIREKDKQENTALDLTEGIDYLVFEKQTNYRFNYSYKISESFKIKGRAELVNYDKEESPFETGYLLYQDIVYKPKSSPFSFAFRYGIFDTESYNSRIYAYENDVLYAFSIPAYYNRGTRTYLTVKYKIKRGIDLWLRYGLTYYDNVDVISAGGLEEIQGNHKQVVKAQVRFKF